MLGYPNKCSGAPKKTLGLPTKTSGPYALYTPDIRLLRHCLSREILLQ